MHRHITTLKCGLISISDKQKYTVILFIFENITAEN